MRIKYIFFTLIFIAMYFLTFTSCSGDEYVYVSDGIEATSEKVSIFDAVSKRYSDDELEVIRQTNIYDLSQLHEAYPAECVRKGKSGIRVMYLGETRVLECSFRWSDGNEDYIFIEDTMHTLSLTKSDFRLHKIWGKTSDEMRFSYATEGDYSSFLTSGIVRDPLTSTHCTEDGYYVLVRYQRENLHHKVIGVDFYKL